METRIKHRKKKQREKLILAQKPKGCEVRKAARHLDGACLVVGCSTPCNCLGRVLHLSVSLLKTAGGAGGRTSLCICQTRIFHQFISSAPAAPPRITTQEQLNARAVVQRLELAREGAREDVMRARRRNVRHVSQTCHFS